MDVGNISSLSSAISQNRLTQVQSESQVRVLKKQNQQQQEVAATILESTRTQDAADIPEKGKLLAVA